MGDHVVAGQALFDGQPVIGETAGGEQHFATQQSSLKSKGFKIGDHESRVFSGVQPQSVLKNLQKASKSLDDSRCLHQIVGPWNEKFCYDVQVHEPESQAQSCCSFSISHEALGHFRNISKT